jgi:hypothetical protein
MTNNKMMGLSKIQKSTNVEESPSPWIFSGKGKSLGKKPNGATMRDRDFLVNKIGKTKAVKEARNHNEEEQYADDWDEFEQKEGDRNTHLLQEKT